MSNKLSLVLGASLFFTACGTPSAHADEAGGSENAIVTSSDAALQSSSPGEPSTSSSGSAASNSPTQSDTGAPAPAAGDSTDHPSTGPSTDTPTIGATDDPASGVTSLDGKARIAALHAISNELACLFKANDDVKEEVKKQLDAVQDSWGEIDSTVLKINQSMDKYPAGSNKRQILLGQLRNKAAGYYDQLSILTETLPNTEANRDEILKINSMVDAFRLL